MSFSVETTSAPQKDDEKFRSTNIIGIKIFKKSPSHFSQHDRITTDWDFSVLPYELRDPGCWLVASCFCSSSPASLLQPYNYGTVVNRKHEGTLFATREKERARLSVTIP